MVQRKDLLTFQFYKKEKFTGSCCGIRYLIRKETQDESDVFALYTWNGPYAFASTPETERTKHTFPGVLNRNCRLYKCRLPDKTEQK